MRLASALVVIALAAALRLWHLDLAEFKNDEAGWLRRAEDVVQLGTLPLAGEGSSLQIASPPHFIYLMAPVVALNRDPQFGSAAIGLMNAGAVAGTIFLGWRAFSPLVGLVAGLAFAANPWAVFLGRKIWDPEVVPPLVVLLFIALDRGVIARRAVWAAATFPLLTLAIQMHASAGALAPLLLFPAVVLISCRWPGHLALGLALSALIAWPYLVYLSGDLTDVRTLTDVVAHSGVFNADGAARIIGLTAGWDNWYIDGVHLEFLLPGRVASAPGRVETVLLALGVLVAAMLTLAPRRATVETEESAIGQRPQPEVARLRVAGLLLWLLLPAVLTIRHSFPLYDHYFLSVFPAAALLIGVGVQWFADRWRPVAFTMAAALIGAALVQVTMVVRALDFLSAGYAQAYGPPLVRSEAMARDVVQFGLTSASRHLSVELGGLDREPVAYLARPFFPVLDLADVGAVGLGTTRAVAPSGDMTVLKPTDTSNVHFPDGVHAPAGAISARGRPGQPVAFAMRWVADAMLPAELLWTVALQDPNGRQVASGTGIRHYPKPDEVVVSWFTLTLPVEAPDGIYSVRIHRLDQPDIDFDVGTIDVVRG